MDTMKLKFLWIEIFIDNHHDECNYFDKIEKKIVRRRLNGILLFLCPINSNLR